MKNIYLLSLATLITISSVSASSSAGQTHHQLNTDEINAVIGQWDYDLVTKDGTKIKGFFQVEPSNKGKLPVVGQAYFDKGDKTLSTTNLRGVWTGLMKREKQQYVVTFLMHGNPINPNTRAESAYHGTIRFQLKDDTLDGTFKDHDAREGVDGTIIARRHQ